MVFEVVFDIETKKFFDEIAGNDPADLGVSIVSLYARELDDNFKEVSGQMYSFFEKDFEEMWKLFLKADRIIGFNSFHFDVPALKPNAPPQWPKLPHFDIMAHVKDASGKRVALNSLARETLGLEKNDSGANAITYFASGNPEDMKRLQKYCEMDVEITTKIYDHGREHGKLKYIDFWNTPRAVLVNFSYPENYTSPAKQEALF